MSATPWPNGNRPRIAGVSSFGFSGTNAHIVIEEAPPLSIESQGPNVTEIITVSAKDKTALVELCSRHAGYLRRHSHVSLSDFAFTLNSGRAHFQHRVALVVGSIEEAANKLEAITDSNLDDHRGYRFIAGYEQPSIGFLFTGQGSQYPGMGRELYAQSSAFRSAIDDCDRILDGKLQYRLAAVLCGEHSVPPNLIHETAWTQPTLFAFEYALAMLWRSWGVQPSVVLGHSLGEYVAACIAGVFSLKEGLLLAYERGRLMGGLPHNGGMLAVRAGESEIAEMIRPLQGLSIAALNGSRNAVVSGASEQIEQLQQLLAARNVVSQRLTVSHAFHSDLMEPILDEFELQAARLNYTAPRIPMVSNLSGRIHSAEDRIDAPYWRRHIRDTVRFSQGFSSLMEQRPAALLEIGPDPVLLGMAKPALLQSSIPCLPSLRRGREAWQSMHEALCELYLLGATIDWSQVYRDRSARKLALPTYPFQRRRYWVTLPAKFVTAEAAPVAPARQPFDSMLYTTEWQPAESYPLLAPGQLVDAAERIIDSTSANREKYQVLTSYGDFLPRVDRLCAIYTLETLRRLGLDTREGVRVSRDGLPARLGVQPEHLRLLERLIAILEEDEIVFQNGNSWVFKSVPVADSRSEHASVAAEFPLFSAELNFLGQASHLAEVMQGRMSPLDALFPNGSFSLAERIYRDAPAAQMFNLAVGEVVKRAVEAYSPDRMVKVTEVGAGTGATTSQILPLLDGKHVDYLFTDISPAFCDAARRKFSNFPFVRYAALDLEADGGEHTTFAEKSDIVVAANVLHATPDLKQALQRVRRMLRKGGSLVIFELTAPQRFGDLTTGMTKGWWHFKDGSLRRNYPLIGRQRWIELLTECGFRCSALEADGPLETLTQRHTILVAQPYETTPQADSPSVLLVNGTATSEALSLALETAGCVIHRLGSDAASYSSKPDGDILREWLCAETGSSAILLELPGAPNEPGVPESALNNADAVLKLLQAVVEEGPSRRTIWLITRGAATEVPGGLHLSSTAVDAMAKTARLEHPELSIRWVDLPSVPTEKDLARLGELVREGTSEHSLAVREGKIVAPRLVSLSAISSRDAERCTLNPGAIYLVTGAYGGLGFRTAQWMVERGATSIVMVGRREPSPQIRDQIVNLREAGIRIYDLTGDISERSVVERIFRRIEETGLGLRGIVHAAGTLKDGTLLQQTREQFATVFKPKVHGSWLLHEFSRRSPLDFFVLYGSAASVLGSAGQSNHAGANGFLDGLSRLRQRQGLPSTTIAWGAWSEIGAASHLTDIGRGARLGLNTFSPEKGIELLEQAILSGRPEVAALPVDWQVYLSPGQAQCAWPLFRSLSTPGRDDPSPSDRPVHDRRLALKSLLERATAENRLNVIKEYVRPRVAEVLALDSGFAFREDQPLAELGLDSLMALELKNELQVALGITLPANLFFEYPSLNLAATFVDARLAAADGNTRPLSNSSEYEELTI